MSNETIAFKNVEVTAVPQIDPKSGKDVINVTLNPAPLTVTEPNTIINFQLVDPTPAELKFAGVKVAPPNDQLSPAAISTDGRNLTLSDVNTVTEDFVVTFEFNTQLEAVPALRSGPDVVNRPER